jgi:hypothetical protein
MEVPGGSLGTGRGGSEAPAGVAGAVIPKFIPSIPNGLGLGRCGARFFGDEVH